MKKKTDLFKLAAAGLVVYPLLACLFLSGDVEAVPAFARKYGFSCSTCHAPVPRLKPYGEEFAGNGFQLPDDQEPIRAFRDTGDPALMLQRELPVGIRFDAYYVHGGGDAEFSDLQTPWALKLLSGGQIARNIGYYFYFYLSERGGVEGIEDGYVHFNNLGGTPLDIMVGQFQISDPLMKRELRLTYEDYQAYKASPGQSLTNLTYDRGIMVTYDLPFGVGLVGQLVNGNGKPEAWAGNGGTRLYDVDRDKGYSLRAIGEIGPVGVGGFYYATKEQLTAGPFTNKVAIAGPDLNVSLMESRLNMTVQYLQREDSNPALWLTDVTTNGIIGEMTYLPQGEDGRLVLILLYNRITSDDPGLAYLTATVSASYLLARNLRLMGEITRDHERGLTRLVVGFVSGF